MGSKENKNLGLNAGGMTIVPLGIWKKNHKTGWAYVVDIGKENHDMGQSGTREGQK